MYKIINLFEKHPQSVCLTYVEHFKLSMGLSFKLSTAAIKAFIHSILPFLFVTSTSDIVLEIEKILKENKCR